MMLETLYDMAPWDRPADTDKIVLDVLRNSHAEASELLLAAELAGDLSVVNDELAAELLSIIGNRDLASELRERATISLGPVLETADLDGFDDPEDVPVTKNTFNTMKNALRKAYQDADMPKDIRRRILEASVRAPDGWHLAAVRDAWASGDNDWRLTAVFAMRWIRGFDKEILEVLESDNRIMHYHAVEAAGANEIDAAWPHISRLLTSKETEQALLFAAIDASINIRPEEAIGILSKLIDSDDDDIVDAAHEAIAMAESLAGLDDLNDDDFDEEEDDQLLSELLLSRHWKSR